MPVASVPDTTLLMEIWQTKNEKALGRPKKLKAVCHKKTQLKTTKHYKSSEEGKTLKSNASIK